jgi:hypothetical protein
MDWLSFLNTATVGAFAGFLGAYLLWILKRNYVRDQLLADRRDERRHQAILEALRVMALVREDLLARNLKDPDFPDEYRIPQQKWCVAREALKKRLTKEEGAELDRLSTNPNDKGAYWKTRDYLISLLN